MSAIERNMIKQNLKHLTMAQLVAIKANQYRSKNCRVEYCEESVNERIWELAAKIKYNQEEPQQDHKTIFPPLIKTFKQIKEQKIMTFQFINTLDRPNLYADQVENQFTIYLITAILTILIGGLFLC